MQIELGFGDGLQRVEVPKRNLLGILTPNSAPARPAWRSGGGARA